MRDRRRCTSWLLALTLIAQAFVAPAATLRANNPATHPPASPAAPAPVAQGSQFVTVFGPTRFTRKTGQPTTSVAHFALPPGVDAAYTMHIQNGAPDGTKRVTSGRIHLNGVEIVSPSDFNQHVAAITRYGQFAQNNTLEVRLAGQPNSYLTITVTVTQPPPATPSLTSVEPTRAVQGQTLQVTLRGQDTHWVSGLTRASLGGEVSVGGAPAGELGPVTVTGPTTATAQVTVSPTAALAPRTALVTTPPASPPNGVSETVTLADAFNVHAATPPGASSTSVATVAGEAGSPGFADGTGAAARFRNLAALAVGSDGTVYVADAGNHRIRTAREQTNAQGAPELIVTTLAGDGAAGFADGPAAAARFNNPQGVVVDAGGAVIVADTGNHRIRRIGTDGTVTTLAGDGTPGLQNGAASQARFKSPHGVAVDQFGNVYVADTGNSAVRVVTPAGEVRTAAGDGTAGAGDSPAARFNGLAGIAADGENVYVYLADTGNHRIRRLYSNDAVITIAGAERGFADGSANAARFAEPSGIALDGSGKIIIADAVNSLVRQVDPVLATGGSPAAVTTLAGTGERGRTDGSGDRAQFVMPRGIVVLRSSAVVVADTGNHTLRRILLPPAITSITPSQARPLATVTISGERFDARAPERNTVRFTRSAVAGGGQTVARVTAATARELTVVVPADVTTGPVTVQTDGGVSNEVDFALSPAPAPTINGFAPKRGPVGTLVTLTGAALRADIGEVIVTFTGANNTRLPALVSYASETEVRTTAPIGAVTGPIELINAWGSASTAEPFTVESQQDFSITIAPSSATAVQRGSATYLISLNSPQTTFAQLARLSAAGLPTGVRASFDPAQITAGATSTLTVNLSEAELSPGSYPFNISAAAEVEGHESVRTAGATLVVAPAGQTTLSGRVLNTDSEPVVGAIASLDGQTATTDAAGSFLLVGITAGPARALMIDGRTASAPNRTYPIITEPANVVAGQANVIPYTFYLPPIDVQYEVDVVPGRDTVAANPRVKGLQMIVPAGANLRNRDGSPVARVSITPLAIDRTPTPLPSNVATSLVYTSQPGGALTDIPIPVVYPNLLGTDPGTRVELYAFNHDTVQWYVYGYGRVSNDGRTIAPEINPNTGRPYGLPDFSWHFPAPPPPPPDPASPDSCPSTRTTNTVDLATGIKVETNTDISFGGARGGVSLSRTYTSGMAFEGVSGRFGRGTKDNYDIRLTGSFIAGGAGRLLTHEEQRGDLFSFARAEADGTLVFNSTQTTGQLGDIVRRLPDGTLELRRAEGSLTRFDADGRPVSMVDKNGNETMLSYTGDDLTQITDAVGRSIQLDYDSSSRIVGATDPLGRQWRYEYSNGMLVKVTDPLEQVTRYGYDGDGLLLSVTDKRGNLAKSLTYFRSGVVQTQRYADGATENYGYSFSGTLITGAAMTDALGRTRTLRLNAAGYVVETTDAFGQRAGIERDLTTNLPTMTKGPCGCAEATREFDERGNVLAVTDRNGQTERMEFEASFNNITKTTDQLGQINTYTYDERGNLASSTDAQNRTTAKTYDEFGLLTSVTDPLGRTWSVEYDYYGNVSAQIDALGHRTTMEYDVLGNRTAVVDPLGRRTSIAYDDLDRVTSMTDPSGAVTRLFYDANGNQTRLTDALNHKWGTAFDLRNRPVSKTDPLGRTTRMEYNLGGELIKTVSPTGRTTHFTYDQRGQKATMTDELGGVVRYEYDSRRNLASLTDQRGSKTTFVYDELFRLKEVRDPLGRASTVKYDSAGNAVESVDRLGRRIQIAYDSLNRPTRMTYPDAVVTYTYDAVGKMTRVDDSQSGSIEWGFDEANRMVSETTPAGVVSYAYNDANERTSMQVAGRPQTTYGYDDAGRLQTISQGAETFTLAYDALSQLASLQRPNGVATTYEYDAANRLVRMAHANSQVLEDFRYAFDADGEIASVASLFSAPRLPQAATAGPADAANRVTQFGGAGFSFDDEGQPLGKTQEQGQTGYQWDARGRLMRATLPDGRSVSYAYDALGRRVSRTAGAETTSYVYDGQDVVLDRNGDAGAVDYMNAAGVDEKLRQSGAATGPLYYLQDHLGSTVALADAGGNVVERQQYEPYGESPGSALTRYGYTGRERDDQTGLIYYRARWYDPQQGRFISEDPARFEGGLNMYAYVGDDPTNSIDPFGLQTVGPSRNPGNFPNARPVCTVPNGGKGIEFLPDHDIIGPKWRPRLEKAFKEMLENCECRQAFLDIGVDLADVWNKGVIIGSASLITDSGYSDAQLRLTGAERAAARPLVNNNNAFTGRNSQADPRPHIFFNMAAYNTGMRTVLAHELIHAGGIDGQDPGGFWGALGWDDLDYLNPKYRNVLRKCG